MLFQSSLPDPALRALAERQSFRLQPPSHVQYSYAAGANSVYDRSWKHSQRQTATRNSFGFPWISWILTPFAKPPPKLALRLLMLMCFSTTQGSWPLCHTLPQSRELNRSSGSIIWHISYSPPVLCLCFWLLELPLSILHRRDISLAGYHSTMSIGL